MESFDRAGLALVCLKNDTTGLAPANSAAGTDIAAKTRQRNATALLGIRGESSAVGIGKVTASSRSNL
jgi:hypothetical protein